MNQDNQKFLRHTAETIYQLAETAHPGDPRAAARTAVLAASEGEPKPGFLVDYLTRCCSSCAPEPQRPMDTSDIDPETGEEWGVIPEGQVWVEVTSTRDEHGRVTFTSYYPDRDGNGIKSSDGYGRLGDMIERLDRYGIQSRVMTIAEAQRFHAARGE